MRPWNPSITARRVTALPACRAPGTVIVRAWMSDTRQVKVTDSDPLLRNTNRPNGQAPRLRPISRVSRSVSPNWLNEGVMTFAIGSGWFIASSTAAGAWPRPSMP